uniref:Uncharacterized protein n=1 Tax=Arundo donax TaxID=35708 RepID=A0A0A9BB06_ARUDO
MFARHDVLEIGVCSRLYSDICMHLCVPFQ